MSIKKQLHHLFSLQRSNSFHINDIMNAGYVDTVALSKATEVKHYLEYEIEKLYKVIKENGLHVTIDEYISTSTTESDSYSSFAKFISIE